MIRLALAALACLASPGCLNWQASYDSAARAACDKLIDVNERRDCLIAVDDNSADKRRQFGG